VYFFSGCFAHRQQEWEPFRSAHTKFVVCDYTIENRLHYRRDGALGEDACQVRKGSAPHVLAVLNSFVLALFDFCKVSNTKQQMRSFDADPLQAVRLLLKPLAEN
jgi:hypothetical protein